MSPTEDNGVHSKPRSEFGHFVHGWLKPVVILALAYVLAGIALVALARVG